MNSKNDQQEIGRIRMLRRVLDTLDEYLLDNCPDNENWEDFDPDIDALRNQVQQLLEGKP